MKKWWLVLAGLLFGYAFGAVLSPGRIWQEVPLPAEYGPAPVVTKQVAAVPEDPHSLPAIPAKTVVSAAGGTVNGDDLKELSAALDKAQRDNARYMAQIDTLTKENADLKKPEPRRESWAEREARRKIEDPEGYAERQNQRKEFQDKMERVIADKSAFLVNLDTADMTEKEKTSHNELLSRIAETWDTINAIQTNGAPTRDQMEAMHENQMIIRDLYNQERDYVLRQVGTDLGYDEQEAQAFSTYMKDVFDKTSPSMPRSAWGGGRDHSRHSSRDSAPKAP